VTLVPTLVLHETLSRLDDSTVYRDPSLRLVPEEVRRGWDLPNLVRQAGWTSGDFTAFRAARPKQDLFLREFVRAGGTVVAGTGSPRELMVPGLALHQELELLVRAGLSPAQALLTATRDAARLAGADSVGTLAPGKGADLIVLTKEPLQDIRNTRAIERVMVRGRLLSLDSLKAR
jgi:imidazolonepropionase-like amidohydrolase